MTLFCFSVPSEIDPTTALSPDTTYYEVGSNVNLSCSIRFIKSTYIDVNTRVHINWMPGEVSTSTVLHENTSHSLQYTVYNLKLSQAGEYKCLYYIDTAEPSFYIKKSITRSDVTNITAISKKKLFSEILLLYYSLTSTN